MGRVYSNNGKFMKTIGTKTDVIALEETKIAMPKNKKRNKKKRKGELLICGVMVNKLVS